MGSWISLEEEADSARGEFEAISRPDSGILAPGFSNGYAMIALLIA
ncbi:MAG: hypothetical protein RMK30_09835 [Anaerolineae bacterium]|nr:hypothetical protein [Anaerolineae bacterium]MDW8103164.1 hypothetical protein [Anaerolineae bacterium]